MAHFVKLDDNNIVQQSIVVSNQDTSDASGNESEAIGIAFVKDYLELKLIGSKPLTMTILEEIMLGLV